MLSRELIRILAKSGRIEVLRTLKANHDGCFTVNELARTSGVPVMTTWRAVKELKKAGLVTTRKVGNATSVSITGDSAALRALKVIPDTDPHRAAARAFAEALSAHDWLDECKVFGTVGRGDHRPGEEVDVAVVFDGDRVDEDRARAACADAAASVKERTNVTVAPLCVSRKEMARRGGLGAELRDKESIWRRAKGLPGTGGRDA